LVFLAVRFHSALDHGTFVLIGGLTLGSFFSFPFGESLPILSLLNSTKTKSYRDHRSLNARTVPIFSRLLFLFPLAALSLFGS